MREWIVVFMSSPGTNPKRETVEKGDLQSEALKHFDAAKMTGTYEGREFIGMWIEDKLTEQGDVIKIAGLLPPGIRIRHEEYKARTKDKKKPRPERGEFPTG